MDQTPKDTMTPPSESGMAAAPSENLSPRKTARRAPVMKTAAPSAVATDAAAVAAAGDPAVAVAKSANRASPGTPASAPVKSADPTVRNAMRHTGQIPTESISGNTPTAGQRGHGKTGTIPKVAPQSRDSSDVRRRTTASLPRVPANPTGTTGTVKTVETAKNPSKSAAKAKKKRRGKLILRIVLRTLLAILLVISLAFASLWMILDDIFNGPSESARDLLTMALLEASATKWVPALFIGEETVEQIRAKDGEALPEEKSDPSIVTVRKDSVSAEQSDRFEGHPDGILIEEVNGDTYNAYVMLIRDPSKVYLAASNKNYSKSVPGTRINRQIETEGAIAAINGGAFFDDGTTGSTVGSVPCGLVVSGGNVLWNDGSSYDGFAGFNEDDILVVAKTMSAGDAKELKIRDGCCFGPVLIMNGTVNEEAYNTNSGYNPRTAIGQCADGTVLFVCVDGRQAGSLGATYADVIDIFVHYGAVNACNLDGGSSTVMLYKDAQGLYGEPGATQMINNYSLLQAEPRRMPTFFMVRPADAP